MKRLLWLLLLLPIRLPAQVNPQITGAGAPSGSCTSTQTYLDTTNHVFYFCNNGTWALQGSTPGAQGSSSGGSSSGSGYGNTGPVFNCVTGYGAVGDGSTNNATALTNCVAASNAYVQHPTNAQGLTDLPTVYLPPGTFNFTGGLNFTSPAILRCEQGAVLNPTGTGNSNGHAIEIGPSTLTGNTYQTYYFIIGCGFTGGASLTSHAIFINSFVLNPRIWDSRFFNFAGTGTSPVTWAIAFAGNVDDPDVERNGFFNDDNVVHNGVAVLSANGQVTNILRFVNNIMVSAMPPGALCSTSSHAAQNAGIGVLSDGEGSTIAQNEIAWYQPDIRLGSNSQGTAIYDNTNLEASPCATTSVIQYGDAAGGNNVSKFIDAVRIVHNSTDMHNTDFAQTNSLMQPTTASTGLTNAIVESAILEQYNVAGTVPVIVLNNTAGQTGNTYKSILGGAVGSTMSAATLINTNGSNIQDPFKGTTTEGDGSGQPTYGMACSGGNAGISSCYQRLQAHSTIAGSLVRFIMDTASDGQAYPNRGGFVQHTSGAGGGTKIGDWEALDVQVLTSPSAGALGLHTVFLHQGGIADEGTKFGISGCSTSATAGGAATGKFASGTTGTCTIVITPGGTAPNGWFCRANDLTTTADTVLQTATTQTTATMSGTTVSGDVLNFGCTAY